ncbi:MAG TPA: TRAP transporter substrate-binding protein DctP [Propionibacterium sp.]|nr:TRAP transporter substrate-binding protein DctP [Propionibacterium sp.]
MLKNSAQLRASIAAAVALASLAGCSANSAAPGDQKKELTVATHAARNSRAEAVSEYFYKEVERRTDGRLTFRVTAPDSLCPPAEVAECTRDGRADVGLSIAEYAPQVFPTATVMGIPFVTQDEAALRMAFHQVNREHEGAKALWEERNLRPLVHWSPGRINIGTLKEISRPADLDGQRIRTAGPYLEAALATLGASNVSVTASETYEAVERGLADGTAFGLEGALDFRMTELLPHWTDVGIGHYSTFGMWMNGDVYDGLSDADRKVVEEVALELSTPGAVDVFMTKAAERCEEALANKDIESLSKWDDATVADWKTEIGQTLIERWTSDAETAGLKDAKGYFEAYTAALAEFADPVHADPFAECYQRAKS